VFRVSFFLAFLPSTIVGYEYSYCTRNMERGDESTLLSFLRTLEKKESSTIRVFDRADTLSVLGDDAMYVALEVYKTKSVLKWIGHDKSVAMCNMTFNVFQNFLKSCLLTKGLRVEIFAQEGKRWKQTKQASPGNLQDVEDLIFGQIDANPVIIAVKVSITADQKNIGVAFADAGRRELGVSEFFDNEVYSNFESLLIQLGVKECLLQADESGKDYELGKLTTLIDRCGVVVTERKAKEFNIRDVEHELSRLLSGEVPTGALPETELKLAMGSAAALISYLMLSSDSSNYGQYKLYQHDLSQYMKLDASALKALNLMPGPRDGGNKNMSLFGLLNQCKTILGTRLLGQWLKQPLTDVSDIERRHTLVEAFMEYSQIRQALQEEHLKTIPDLHRLGKRFQKRTANLEDVVRVYQVVIKLPNVLLCLDSIQDERYRERLESSYITDLNEICTNLEKLGEMVETTVDLEALDRHEFLIKADFDANLKAIRGELDAVRLEMQEEHERVGEDLNQDTEKKLRLERHQVYGWCLRLTTKEAGSIRNKKGYTDLGTQKAGLYFSTPTLSKLANSFEDLQKRYNSMQSGLVKEVVDIAATYCPVLDKLAILVAHLDVIVCFAYCALLAPTPYVRPLIHAQGEGSLKLVEARHPCMEVQEDIMFIANEVDMVRGESEFCIITGPNMGGKSTYIRSIGVIVLMAQVGCFVPCTSAEIVVVDCILARVGASDSQLKGVSTFMAEMLETSTILKSSTKNSLIIIDELGRGTSTYDGFGLAWAISEHIIKNIGCFALFATHFHELAALEEDFRAVKNLHVVAHVDKSTPKGLSQDGNEITLLYKVEAGICDQSFGIHVAELVRFPPKVIRMAKRKAEELEDFSGKRSSISRNCSDEEVARGSDLLKGLISDWKSKVDEGTASEPDLLSTFQDSLQKYEGELKASPWIQEIMADL